MFLSRHLFFGRLRRARRLIGRANRARDAGNYAAAASLYRRALAFDPRRTDIRVQLAHMLKELTRFGEAEAAYRQAMAQLPNDGDRLRDGRRFAEAADAYGSALSLSPTRNDIRIQQGNMLKDAGLLAQAESTYRDALAQTPEDADI